MSDKRSVSTDALETLGNIIDETAGRDAIHLAVEPSIAMQSLNPGQHVGFVEGGVGVCSNPIGIVDPFLGGTVQKGDRFWLLVYPRTITSLRHVWSHPLFPEEVSKTDVKTKLNNFSISERWVREFAESIPLDYNVLMLGAKNWLESKRAGGFGEYLCFGGLLEGEHVPDEFWTHFENITGETVEESNRESFFTCSC